MIVMANSVEDVQKSVLFANRYDLLVTVHSSGHDYNGRSTADGSLMIDLSSMKEISINLQSKRHEAGEVTVESGNSWLKIYEKVQSVDRVVVGGSSHTVSPGGYTLGGGHSPISRSFGLAADQVLETKHLELFVIKALMVKSKTTKQVGLGLGGYYIAVKSEQFYRLKTKI
ncbi:hypothetical protein CHS0354_004434 [Potamilus streckersoni]|uniref:FAD-binding PCMH-type domain-containing protein n=1 Tax=Potamilus streckersoni TaxID=2493646 RepID=A0AAE0WBB8_9BIVA|nr:hypothetical protein CHS0354_004434 [Potamilus streckersoni]